MTRLNRGSKVTLPVQMCEDLRRRIVAHEFEPGDKIPTALELALDYEVSLMTARTAVTQLANEGTVVAVSGRGTFVADPQAAVGTVDTAETTAHQLNHLSAQLSNLRTRLAAVEAQLRQQ